VKRRRTKNLEMAAIGTFWMCLLYIGDSLYFCYIPYFTPEQKSTEGFQRDLFLLFLLSIKSSLFFGTFHNILFEIKAFCRHHIKHKLDMPTKH
jgi:hypothetical protein